MRLQLIFGKAYSSGDSGLMIVGVSVQTVSVMISGLDVTVANMFIA